MRARHRHFNSGHAGAKFCLDARYGFSQADNTNVSQWTDRTANGINATQATSSYQPVYNTGIFGGSPAVKFLPVSFGKKRLDGSVTITNDVMSTVVVAQYLLSNTNSNSRLLTTTKDGGADYNSTTRAIALMRYSTSSAMSSFKNSAALAIASFDITQPFHASNVFDGSNVTNYINNSLSSSSASSGNFDINQFRIGNSWGSESGIQDTWSGYIAHVSFFNAAISTPMRKRIQFSNAYSFKIACS